MPLSKQRRSLSTVRSEAPIEAEGPSAIADALRAALAAGNDDEVARALTHGFHTYPARMHPATARELVALCLAGPRARRRSAPTVLDPFCGSGTSLVEASFAGARGLGVDANPLAVRIARAKTWHAPAARRQALVEAATSITQAALDAGKMARRAAGNSRRRPPPSAAARRRSEFLSQWFAPHVRAELETLRTLIAQAKDDDSALGDLLVVALSSILYKVSLRRSDTSEDKVERSVARGAAARLFERRVRELAGGLDELAAVDSPPPRIVEGDARDLAAASIQPATVDAIVTSPPYAATYDYLDFQDLRLRFFELAPSQKGKEIGSRSAFSGDAERRGKALANWTRAVRSTMKQMSQALRPGGRAAIITGDSYSGEEAIYTREMYERACPPDLPLIGAAAQSRPLVTGAERRAFAKRDKREHILLFEKQ